MKADTVTIQVLGNGDEDLNADTQSGLVELKAVQRQRPTQFGSVWAGSQYRPTSLKEQVTDRQQITTMRN